MTGTTNAFLACGRFFHKRELGPMRHYNGDAYWSAKETLHGDASWYISRLKAKITKTAAKTQLWVK